VRTAPPRRSTRTGESAIRAGSLGLPSCDWCYDEARGPYETLLDGRLHCCGGDDGRLLVGHRRAGRATSSPAGRVPITRLAGWRRPSGAGSAARPDPRGARGAAGPPSAETAGCSATGATVRSSRAAGHAGCPAGRCAACTDRAAGRGGAGHTLRWGCRGPADDGAACTSGTSRAWRAGADGGIGSRRCGRPTGSAGPACSRRPRWASRLRSGHDVSG